MSELVVLENLTPAIVFKEGGGDPIVERIKQEVLSVDRDISTEEGRNNIKSLAYKVAKSKTFLDDMGKTFAADLKKQTKAIDTERARIWDALEALQKEVRKPLTEFEEAEQTRIQGHESRLVEIEMLGSFEGVTPTAQDIQGRLDAIPGHMQRDWEEFGKRATEASDRIRTALQTKLAERQKQDSEQAELQRLRAAEQERQQREHEERLKAEAADKARKEAEEKAAAAARDAEQKAAAEIAAQKEAAEKANRAAQEAADRERKAEEARKEAMEQAERNKKEAAARAVLEKLAAIKAERERAEAQKQAEAEAAVKREADIKHRAKINNAALKALTTAGLSEENAKLAIEAIAKRQVPNITISY